MMLQGEMPKDLRHLIELALPFLYSVPCIQLKVNQGIQPSEVADKGFVRSAPFPDGQAGRGWFPRKGNLYLVAINKPPDSDIVLRFFLFQENDEWQFLKAVALLKREEVRLEFLNELPRPEGAIMQALAAAASLKPRLL